MSPNATATNPNIQSCSIVPSVPPGSIAPSSGDMGWMPEATGVPSAGGTRGGTPPWSSSFGTTGKCLANNTQSDAQHKLLYELPAPRAAKTTPKVTALTEHSAQPIPSRKALGNSSAKTPNLASSSRGLIGEEWELPPSLAPTVSRPHIWDLCSVIVLERSGSTPQAGQHPTESVWDPIHGQHTAERIWYQNTLADTQWRVSDTQYMANTQHRVSDTNTRWSTHRTSPEANRECPVPNTSWPKTPRGAQYPKQRALGGRGDNTEPPLRHQTLQGLQPRLLLTSRVGIGLMVPWRGVMLDDLLRFRRLRRLRRRRLRGRMLLRRWLRLGDVGREGHGLHVHGPLLGLVLQLLHRGVRRRLQGRLGLRLDLH